MAIADYTINMLSKFEQNIDRSRRISEKTLIKEGKTIAAFLEKQCVINNFAGLKDVVAY